MTKTAKLTLAAAIPALLLAGCSDFLKGPGLTTNPNKPTQASPDQLWVGAQVAVMAQWENFPLMLFATWAQQIAGVNRQWKTYAQYTSGVDQTFGEGVWDQTYGPGGYRDLQAIVVATTATGNLRFRGEARVLEALYIGTAADIFGDIPFSDALAGQPTFDTQAAVYTHVLALLDSAITDLAGAGTGSAERDFFFGNDPALWTAAAHTLKARFIMHTARTNATTYSAAALASVVTETGLGISRSDTGDFKAVHTLIPGEQNLFYSFLFSRSGDVDPAAVHINEIKAAGEPFLLPTLYVPNAYGNYYGSAAGAPLGDSVAKFLVGANPPNHSDESWGIVTYAENQMLLAEAQYRQANTATALATLNTYRLAHGGSSIAPVGTAILGAILREKYIRSFFNMEVWNDYLRTCYPNVALPAGANPSQPYVPARLPVSYLEQISNPNVPTQPSGNPPNANNFKLTVWIDGVTACTGQVGQP